MARNENGHFEVQALSGKGKEEWIRFDIVQQSAITRQETQSGTATNASVTSEPSKAEATSSTPAAPTIEAPVGTTAGANMGFPSKWKSMTSGTVRTLRFETNYIYGELILPDAAVKAGAFTLLELKKDGDKYVGKINRKAIRSDGGASCSMQAPIELTLVTPERIEGNLVAPPPTSKIDWVKCSFTDAPERQEFVWIPVK